MGGKNSEIFISQFKDNLERVNEFDFISLNCNYERRLHFQSYFLCFSNIVFQNNKFQDFWKGYIPLNNRFHAIENGEKRLSRKVLSNFRSNVLYQSHKLAESISLNLKDYDFTLFGNLPKGLMYLGDKFDIKKITQRVKNF